ELAKQERDEIEVIKGFLPQQMSEAEVKAAIAEAIKATGAAGVKDMGKVMAALKERYAGRMDFGKASGAVKGMLG
ncbi:MAG TPA: GatB/YqeY domain-containing protein, partial [Xanthobacteraceae bacterium]|nr:GatB/YqeY domain-containing protein [Xanthobacteraceae bacterium]